MELSAILALIKTYGPGSALAVPFALLWWDERRERRQIQRHVAKLHRENTKRLLTLLKRTAPATDAHGSTTAKSGSTKRRGGG